MFSICLLRTGKKGKTCKDNYGTCKIKCINFQVKHCPIKQPTWYYVIVSWNECAGNKNVLKKCMITTPPIRIVTKGTLYIHHLHYSYRYSNNMFIYETACHSAGYHDSPDYPVFITNMNNHDAKLPQDPKVVSVQVIVNNKSQAG